MKNPRHYDVPGAPNVMLMPGNRFLLLPLNSLSGILRRHRCHGSSATSVKRCVHVRKSSRSASSSLGSSKGTVHTDHYHSCPDYGRGVGLASRTPRRPVYSSMGVVKSNSAKNRHRRDRGLYAKTCLSAISEREEVHEEFFVNDPLFHRRSRNLLCFVPPGRTARAAEGSHLDVEGESITSNRSKMECKSSVAQSTRISVTNDQGFKQGTMKPDQPRFDFRDNFQHVRRPKRGLKTTLLCGASPRVAPADRISRKCQESRAVLDRCAGEQLNLHSLQEQPEKLETFVTGDYSFSKGLVNATKHNSGDFRKSGGVDSSIKQQKSHRGNWTSRINCASDTGISERKVSKKKRSLDRRSRIHETRDRGPGLEELEQSHRPVAAAAAAILKVHDADRVNQLEFADQHQHRDGRIASVSPRIDIIKKSSLGGILAFSKIDPSVSSEHVFHVETKHNIFVVHHSREDAVNSKLRIESEYNDCHRSRRVQQAFIDPICLPVLKRTALQTLAYEKLSTVKDDTTAKGSLPIGKLESHQLPKRDYKLPARSPRPCAPFQKHIPRRRTKRRLRGPIWRPHLSTLKEWTRESTFPRN